MKKLWILLAVLCATTAPTVLATDTCDDCVVLGRHVMREVVPVPQVTQIEPREDLMADRDYYRVIDGQSLQFYNAPGGTIVSAWKAGDNYVTVYETQDGWGRVSRGLWIDMSQVNKQGVVVSRFTGLELDTPDQPHNIAWSLINQWTALAPGQDPSESSRFLYRYNYFYILDTVQDADGYNWYKVGNNAWVHQFNVSVHAPIEKPETVATERWVTVDLYEQVLTAYEDDDPVFTTLVSTGLPWWGTREGSFNVTWMFQRDDMTQDLPGDFYYLQEVPWTAFFDGGIALHGTFWHDGFGFPQSHGCVNMSITDAHWLFKFIEPEFDAKTDDGGASVFVYNSDPFR
ncbi:MAG: L,D-transpeptidase [Chloroflexota bacterium]